MTEADKAILISDEFNRVTLEKIYASIAESARGGSYQTEVYLGRGDWKLFGEKPNDIVGELKREGFQAFYLEDYNEIQIGWGRYEL